MMGSKKGLGMNFPNGDEQENPWVQPYHFLLVPCGPLSFGRWGIIDSVMLNVLIAS